LILLGVLAAVAASAVGSASASAAVCGAVTAAPDWCEEGVPNHELASPEAVDGTSGESILKGTIAAARVRIKCASDKLTGKVEDGAAESVGKSKEGKITFETCTLVEPANCKLTAAQETSIATNNLKDKLVLTGAGKRIEDEFEPEPPATAFATIAIEGKEASCVIAAVGEVKEFPVTGTQLCEVDGSNAAAETFAETHKVICKTTGSKLKLGGNNASFTSEAAVAFNLDQKWAIRNSV
jgi:hypothetical protein